MFPKSLFRISLVIILTFMLAYAMPVGAQEPTNESTSTEEVATEEPTVEPTEEVTAEPTVEPTEETTPEPTEKATAEPTVEPTEEATAEPTVEPTEEATTEPTVEPTEEATVEPTVEPTVILESELSGADIEAAGALPGSSTTSIIAVANISSGPASVTTELYPYPSGTAFQIGGNPSIPVGGAHFYRSSDITQNGRFGAVIQSGEPVAAAAVLENTSAHVADIYPGLANLSLADTVYATLIFFGHATYETTLYCQNADSANVHITAELYQKGQSTPVATISTANSGQAGDHGGAMLGSGQIVVWDIVDMARVKTGWGTPGQGKYGYAKIYAGTSGSPVSSNIACVFQTERMTTNQHLISQSRAVPVTEASTSSIVPIVFNGHGTSSKNNRALKWNSSVTYVNPGASPANISVTYKTESGYSHTCTTIIPAGELRDWYAPQIGTGTGAGVGWACPSGPLSWQYPGGPTYGFIETTVNSGPGVLALGTTSKYDAAQSWFLGYTTLSASTTTGSNLTQKAVCPVTFNKGSASSTWVTGVQVVNVGGGNTNITVKMVRADTDPTISTNYKTFVYNNVGPKVSKNTYFPNDGGLTNFEGVVFVESSAENIFAGASNSNYGTAVNGAAFYDCVNY